MINSRSRLSLSLFLSLSLNHSPNNGHDYKWHLHSLRLLKIQWANTLSFNSACSIFLTRCDREEREREEKAKGHGDGEREGGRENKRRRHTESQEEDPVTQSKMPEIPCNQRWWFHVATWEKREASASTGQWKSEIVLRMIEREREGEGEGEREKMQQPCLPQYNTSKTFH